MNETAEPRTALLVGPAGHLGESRVRKRNIIHRISQKDLDIVTKTANCCLPRSILWNHPMTRVFGPQCLTKWCSLCDVPPTQQSLSPIDTGPYPWDRIWDHGLSPALRSCRPARSASPHPGLAKAGRLLIIANTHTRRREPAKASRCVTHAPLPRQKHTGKCELILMPGGPTTVS